ncbi:hypothetical protein KIPB_010239, partial [Kipferlia bialata]|eukprot:g7059.t1
MARAKLKAKGALTMKGTSQMHPSTDPDPTDPDADTDSESSQDDLMDAYVPSMPAPMAREMSGLSFASPFAPKEDDTVYNAPTYSVIAVQSMKMLKVPENRYSEFIHSARRHSEQHALPPLPSARLHQGASAIQSARVKGMMNRTRSQAHLAGTLQSMATIDRGERGQGSGIPLNPLPPPGTPEQPYYNNTPQGLPYDSEYDSQYDSHGQLAPLVEDREIESRGEEGYGEGRPYSMGASRPIKRLASLSDVAVPAGSERPHHHAPPTTPILHARHVDRGKAMRERERERETDSADESEVDMLDRIPSRVSSAGSVRSRRSPASRPSTSQALRQERERQREREREVEREMERQRQREAKRLIYPAVMRAGMRPDDKDRVTQSQPDTKTHLAQEMAKASGQEAEKEGGRVSLAPPAPLQDSLIPTIGTAVGWLRGDSVGITNRKSDSLGTLPQILKSIGADSHLVGVGFDKTRGEDGKEIAGDKHGGAASGGNTSDPEESFVYVKCPPKCAILRSLAWTCRLVRMIYRDRQTSVDETVTEASMPAYVLKWARTRYGLPALVEKLTWSLIVSVSYHRHFHKEIETFARMLFGVYSSEQMEFNLACRRVLRLDTQRVEQMSAGDILSAQTVSLQTAQSALRQLFSGLDEDMILTFEKYISSLCLPLEVRPAGEGMTGHGHRGRDRVREAGVEGGTVHLSRTMAQPLLIGNASTTGALPSLPSMPKRVSLKGPSRTQAASPVHLPSLSHPLGGAYKDSQEQASLT